MELNSIVAASPFYQTISSRFAMWQVTHNELSQQPISYQGVHSLLFVVKGSACIQVGSQSITLPSACFIDLLGREKVTLMQVSDDALCYHLLYSEEIIDEIFKSKPPFPLSYIMDNLNKPVPLTAPQSVVTIQKRLELIHEITSNSTHLFIAQQLLSSMTLLYLDIANIYITQQREAELLIESDRKRALFIQFAKLSSQQGAQKHTVAYYASQLCITPQYLARIVKETTQMTVCQFLQKEIICQSIRLLTESSNTILQISEILHFADHSTFTKYFKRHTGFTPTQYRNRK